MYVKCEGWRSRCVVDFGGQWSKKTVGTTAGTTLWLGNPIYPSKKKTAAKSEALVLWDGDAFATCISNKWCFGFMFPVSLSLMPLSFVFLIITC